jgi:hypothetical protein
VLVLVLLFLLVAVFIFIAGRIVVFIGRQFRLLKDQTFGGGELSRLELAQALLVFPGVEQEMQPRHYLLDRWQLAGRASLAARTGRALHAGLALWPGFAGLALRTRFAALAL